MIDNDIDDSLDNETFIIKTDDRFVCEMLQGIPIHGHKSEYVASVTLAHIMQLMQNGFNLSFFNEPGRRFVTIIVTRT